MFGLVRDQRLAVMAYSPLAVGLLTGVYSPDEPPPEDRRILTTVREIAAELGKTPAQVSLAWVLSRDEISVAVVGCDDVEQVDENLGALDCHLSEDQLDRLNRL